MKKLLGIVVLGLLLSGCATSTVGKSSVKSVIKLGSDKNFVCNNYMKGKEFLTTHGLCFKMLSKNYEYDPINKTEIIWNGVSKVFFVFENVNTPMICKWVNLKTWTGYTTGCDYGDGTLRQITFNITEARQWMNNNFAKSEKEKTIKKKKKKNVVASNNTLNRSFVCSYGGEKSQIKIRGGTATETTAIGISINYSVVNYSSKGAFTLQGSSKDGRAWFIGAQSFLLLGVEMIPYKCK